MSASNFRRLSRRRFFRHLASSPLFAHLAADCAIAQDPPGELVAEPLEALNVFDLAAVARKNLSSAHWTYLMGGSDDGYTVQANRDGFQRLQIRPRRFVYVHQGNTTIELLGERLRTPILLAPAGSQKAFREAGEVASALGARRYQMILSSLATCSIQEVVEAHQSPVWFQLYPSRAWNAAEAMIRKAEEAGCSKLVLTADRPVSGNHEALQRIRRKNRESCAVCHSEGPQGYLNRRPILRGVDYPGLGGSAWPITWDFVDRVRNITDMKVIIKGVMTAEDAEVCVRQGIDAIIVSNHGGRQLESLMGTIEALPEVVQAVGGKMPVLVDGGFRRGTDVFKALALGADAICIGRPYLWGLAAFGRIGVSRILSIMRAELVRTMQLAGVTSINQITSAFVRERPT